MMSFVILFVAGLLTILLPCILPLIPIVLGVSISGRSVLRPLATITGMLVSFVGFTFLLLVVLSQFVEIADYIRIATYDILLLFGIGFVTNRRSLLWLGAIVGGLFFGEKGFFAVLLAAFFGGLAMEVGGRIAARIQQVGVDIQRKAREELGNESLLTAFIIGLTLGLVWVPCAGPALGFAFTLVREEPGVRAALLLSAYGLGTALPLLMVGYGGQWAVSVVRNLSRFSGRIKQISGILLIVSALGLQFRFFENIQIWLITNTNFGNLGTRLEEKIFPLPTHSFDKLRTGSNPLPTGEGKEEDRAVQRAKLPKIMRAPEFEGLGPWHNAEPFTLASLKGKVVLVDFWTYSCINCIRTLPYIQGYWEKFKNTPFVLVGIHTPEFVFEKGEKNVAEAIRRHGLTYPVAQDNDYGTWKAFANRYWPAKYLIDADGYIRYTHFGEGAYSETEMAIRSLLEEIGVGEEKVPSIKFQIPKKSQAPSFKSLTPETYLGVRSIKQLGNGPKIPTPLRSFGASEGQAGKVVSYTAPDETELHKYYLVGDWQIEDGERQVLRSQKGEMRMRFLAGEINLVLGSPSKSHVDIEVDGELVKSMDVEFEDLYELWKGDYGEHEIILRITGAGLKGYAFTFGS